MMDGFDICTLIKKTTAIPKIKTDLLIVDQSLLSAIKNKCKSDNVSLVNAFHYLSVDLTNRNGAVRIRSLIVIDCLFQRSKKFREITSSNIKLIVKSAGLLKTLDANQIRKDVATSYITETENKVKELIKGDTLEVICTDPGVLHDIPAWCRVHGHILLTSERVGTEIIVKIRVA